MGEVYNIHFLLSMSDVWHDNCMASSDMYLKCQVPPTSDIILGVSRMVMSISAVTMCIWAQTKRRAAKAIAPIMKNARFSIKLSSIPPRFDDMKVYTGLFIKAVQLEPV